MDKNQAVFRSGMRGKDKPKGPKLRRVTIESARNGFTVESDWERSNGDGGPLFERPVPFVAVDFPSLFEYLKEELSKGGPPELGKEGKKERDGEEA